MDTNSKALWSGRFSSTPAEIMQHFSQSLDMDWRFYKYDIAGSIAHGKMLKEIGILSADELQSLIIALNEIEEEIKSGEFKPKIALEDVHMNIESRLIEKLGPLGAKIHTGRSRNDQVATDYRLYMKDAIKLLQNKLKILLEALLLRSERDIDIVIPGFTHLQHAQPISLGHYWMAYFWKFSRDYKRLQQSYETTDVNPLGAGALAGSTLPLDRSLTQRELGFSSITENSLDTVSDRDYLLEYLFAASTFFINTSRLCEDLIIWCTSEFNFIELSNDFCTGSSMMPNKKNPDALELIRGKTSGVIGGLNDLMINLKGLPLTYNRDLQEDKRSVFHGIDTMNMVLDILPLLIDGLSINTDSIAPHLKKGFLLATDLAEYLVKKGVPFRDTHSIVGNLVQYCLKNNKDFNDLSMDEWHMAHSAFQEDVLPLLTPAASVDGRNTYGGTARSQVKLQIDKGHRLIENI